MTPAEHGQLTEPERQVARLVAWGASDGDVADALGIEVAAVERHLSEVYRKVGISSGESADPRGGPTGREENQL